METALGLLPEVGIEGLSTRRLAEALEVKSPALYWHFASKRALLNALAEAILDVDGVTGLERQDAAPEVWLAGGAHALRRSLLSHRDGALIYAGACPGENALRHMEARLNALVKGGFPRKAAVRTIWAIDRYTIGWVLEEQAAPQRDVSEDRPAETAGGAMLARAKAALEKHDPTSNFDFGLQALISGAMLHRRVKGAKA